MAPSTQNTPCTVDFQPSALQFRRRALPGGSRVRDRTGLSGEFTLTMPAEANFTTATPVTLRGENAGSAVTVTDNRLSFSLGKYAPASFELH
jgi:hypothetical protein